MHVKYGGVQDDATLWMVGELVKRQRLLGRHHSLFLFLVLQPDRQRVGVDIIDLGVLLTLWSPEEGQRVDEAGRPLHGFNRHGCRRVPSGHCVFIHLGPFRLPGEEDGD